ncbi:hypothetical protein OfM2_15370 [Lactovum odontotermitis]
MKTFTKLIATITLTITSVLISTFPIVFKSCKEKFDNLAAHHAMLIIKNNVNMP